MNYAHRTVYCISEVFLGVQWINLSTVLMNTIIINIMFLSTVKHMLATYSSIQIWST